MKTVYRIERNFFETKKSMTIDELESAADSEFSETPDVIGVWDSIDDARVHLRDSEVDVYGGSHPHLGITTYWILRVEMDDDETEVECEPFERKPLRLASMVTSALIAKSDDPRYHAAWRDYCTAHGWDEDDEEEE